MDPKERMEELKKQIEDLKARLPAHSIPPGMIAELDELDEELDLARARLSTLQGEKDEE